VKKNHFTRIFNQQETQEDYDVMEYDNSVAHTLLNLVFAQSQYPLI